MFGSIGYQEVLVIGVVAILLFGKRLPDVARSWGNSYRELRRSLNEIKSSFAADTYETPKARRPVIDYDDRVSESAPRFVPPTEEEVSAPPADSTPVTDPPTEKRLGA
jgi:sec-independent protein translocase protein TatA